MNDELLMEKTSAVAQRTLNRPDKANALRATQPAGLNCGSTGIW
jgi:enoyl-CoA hydratase/carnithine racemase